MLTVKLTDDKLQYEIDRILNFIQRETSPDHSVIIGVSGGIDSDVALRLCFLSLGRRRIKCFMVLQEDMVEAHLRNAEVLCEELSVPLVKIPLYSFPREFLQVLSAADSEFAPDGFGDTMRAKVTIRTVVLSMYNEHGYVVVSPSNRTELETGLYMSFGDAMGHIKPLTHLYKTQVRQVAKKVGTRAEVLEQTPSSGLRRGANDLEDIAYWLQHGSPFVGNLAFDTKFEEEAREIFELLTFENLDIVLFGLSIGVESIVISRDSGLPEELVERIHKLTKASKAFKGRPLGVSLL